MFFLGQRSEDNLAGVYPGLAKCVRRAITLTTQDFGVFEGLRAVERQRELVRSGASRTMNSLHLPDQNGQARAVDLVPYIGGRLQWQMPGCIQVAIAMREASIHFNERLVWGAVFDRYLDEIDPSDLEGEIEEYIARFRAANPPRLVNGKWLRKDPLIDGPHYQRAA